MLLSKLKSLLSAEPHLATSVARDPLELASAALMMEVARADFATDQVELDAIRALLIAHFSLSDDEVADLAAEAAGAAEAAATAKIENFGKIIEIIKIHKRTRSFSTSLSAETRLTVYRRRPVLCQHMG